MAQGHHHISKHTHPKKYGFLKIMDTCMYGLALIAPIMTIPQLIGVAQHHVAGVSLATWGAYAVVSLLWLVYGILHKDAPLWFTNLLLLIIDSSIVFFVILYR